MAFAGVWQKRWKVAAFSNCLDMLLQLLRGTWTQQILNHSMLALCDDNESFANP
jgi:hypothetical protein